MAGRCLSLPLVASAALHGCQDPGPEIRTIERLSPVYEVDREYRSMMGPTSTQTILFPDGFGLPNWSDKRFSLTTQVLNLNPDDEPHRVRHKVKTRYVRDRDVDPGRPMRPLFKTSGWGLVLLEGDDGFFGVSDPDEATHGASCLPGRATGGDTYRDEFDRLFAGHWVVKPDHARKGGTPGRCVHRLRQGPSRIRRAGPDDGGAARRVRPRRADRDRRRRDRDARSGAGAAPGRRLIAPGRLLSSPAPGRLNSRVGSGA